MIAPAPSPRVLRAYREMFGPGKPALVADDSRVTVLAQLAAQDFRDDPRYGLGHAEEPDRMAFGRAYARVLLEDVVAAVREAAWGDGLEGY